jgi:hypothetical protein
MAPKPEEQSTNPHPRKAVQRSLWSIASPNQFFEFAIVDS